MSVVMELVNAFQVSIDRDRPTDIPIAFCLIGGIPATLKCLSAPLFMHFA